MYSGGIRSPAVRRGLRGERARTISWTSLTKGWVTNESLADQDRRGAIVLDNWFPTERGLMLRGGAAKVAKVGAAAKRVFTYEDASTSRLFVATSSAIYDVTAFDPDAVPSADVSSLTGGDWSTQPISTSGGSYLMCCNGLDAPRVYDGSSWSSASITGITASALSFVWLFKERLFFIETGTLKAHFLATKSIGGAIGSDSGTGTLDLGAVFRRGGELLFGATWSLDAGDGVDDLCVFVTDKGEVAVYQGSDPSSASDWSIVGVYDINRPLGPNASMRAGGDLVIATEVGLVAMSQALQRDRAALGITAVSRPIEPNWQIHAQSSNAGQPWEIIKWTRENKAFVSIPHSSDDETYVVNLTTGAWSRYTGWDVQHMATFGDYAYYADTAGDVYRMESGGTDGGANYVSRFCSAWDDFKSPARQKQIHLMKATFIALAPFTPKISMASDYTEDFPTPPNAVGDQPVAAIWDSGVWDVSAWDDVSGSYADKKTVTTRWRSVSGQGDTFAPQVQITNGNNRRPDAELVRIDATYGMGGLVT